MQNTPLNYDRRLDSAFLESMYENEKEDAVFGFEQFLNSYDRHFTELEQSFETGDVNLFRQKIHKLKPTFSFVGLTTITAKAEVIERKCTETSAIAAIRDLYHDFKDNLFELIPVVKDEYNRLNT